MRWILGLALVVWAIGSWVSSPYTLRWRLTIELDTPQGERTASNVFESSFFRASGAAGGASASLKGEAVFIELDDGRNIVALLAHGPKGENYDAMAALPVTALTGAQWGWAAYAELEKRGGQLSGNVDLTSSLIPTLATISNLSDPLSIRIIDPFGGDFDSLFGRGARLKRVNIEVMPVIWWKNIVAAANRSPTTIGIISKFPWLAVEKGYLGGRFSCNNAVDLCLHAGNFRRS